MEKRFKASETGFSNLGEAQTIRMAIETLQHVMGEEFKSTDIEVGVVSNTNLRFRKLEAAEIEEHLNVIQQFD